MTELHVVVLTSGFQIPETTYVSQVTNVASSVVGNVTSTDHKYEVLSMKDLLVKYRMEASEELLLDIVDCFNHVMCDLSFDDFVKLQANNKHLSNIGFSIVSDLANDNYIGRSHLYSVIPNSVKLGSVDSSIDVVARLNLVKNKSSKWGDVLYRMVSNPKDFISLCNFIFDPS